MEKWTKVKGYESYLISTDGRVKNAKTDTYRKPYVNKRNGYVYVTLSSLTGTNTIKFWLNFLLPLLSILSHPETHKRQNDSANYKISLHYYPA